MPPISCHPKKEPEFGDRHPGDLQQAWDGILAIGSGGSQIDTDPGRPLCYSVFSINVECASRPIGPELLIF